ncbi:MAG: hypothetical protein ABI193_00155 [Minicystis sp.]
MSPTTTRRRPLIGLGVLCLGAALLPSGSAQAESTQVLQLAYGIGGPQKAKGGAGNEQPTSVALSKNGKTYVVTVYMSSNVSNNDGPWQCKCTSVLMDPQDGPVILADQVQLTNGDGDRPCNHPMAATDGQHVVWTFGSDKNNQANVSTYAGVLDEQCQEEYAPHRISQNNNNNEGAPDIAYNGAGHFTAGYLSQGANDISYATGLTLHTDGAISLEQTYLKKVVTPANIGRPAISAAGPDRSLFCAAKGDNRPPEDGVECAWLDALTGNILWKQIVAASEPNNKRYMNQPSVARIDYGRFAVNVQESSGGGKNNNKKGSNISHLYVLEPTDQGYTEKAHEIGLGQFQTHAAVCSGIYGDNAERAIAIMNAPITGVGLPWIQMATYAANVGLKADKVNEWQIGYYGDSGYLANLYGQNPNTQGRDFLRCIGDVANPGHGLPNGFQKNVETFFVAPHAGRIPGEPKNALFLGFVPGKTDKPVVPEPPQDVPPPTSSTSSGSGGGSTTTTTTATTGAGGEGGSAPLGFDSNTSGGCACALPGDTRETPQGPLGALALLGISIALVSRRKS